ncbi:MAG: Abi-alpha family protein, partial [Turicibacter sp.]|nr:Abi-alpha family protein [Turicibacter sp.]
NKEKVDSVHPSFVEIIKQLSATDAQHLVEISNGYDLLDGIPMVNYALDATGGGKKIILEHALATQIKDYKLDMELVEKTSNSLVNLERLGLIYLFND